MINSMIMQEFLITSTRENDHKPRSCYKKRETGSNIVKTQAGGKALLQERVIRKSTRE